MHLVDIPDPKLAKNRQNLTKKSSESKVNLVTLRKGERKIEYRNCMRKEPKMPIKPFKTKLGQLRHKKAMALKN